MKMLRHMASIASGAALALAVAGSALAADDKTAISPDEARAKQAYALGVQAYIWGYPMVVMQRSRDAMTKTRPGSCRP